MANKIELTWGDFQQSPDYCSSRNLPFTQKSLAKILLQSLTELKVKMSQQAGPWTELLVPLKIKKLSLELHLCDDLEMRDFQKQFRKLDRSTDILSFPSIESPDHMPKDFLGSLVISLPAIARNAKRYQKTYRDEFLEVYLHGILHLLGFDHVEVSAKKRRQMMELQKELLTKVLAQRI